MRPVKSLICIAALALLLLIANCSDNDCVNSDPVSGPSVIATYPLTSADDVPTDTTITVTFDKAMNPASISAGSFTLEGPRGLVDATVSFDGDSTATLTPLERLAGHSVHTARINRGVTDTDGRPMGVPYAWTFTSGVTPLWLYPDIEFTIRDTNGDGDPDEFVFGGPPGRFLQSGVEGLQADRAIMEFSLDQIVHDSVLDAIALIELTSSSIAYGIARVEAWGYAGNGAGDLFDWSIGALAFGHDSLELNAGQTMAFPMTDMINAALDSSATHVGLRIVVTGEPVIEIATSGGANDEDKSRILVSY